MKVLYYGIFTFACAFLLHLLIWKIRLPKGQTKTLLKVFIGTLAAGIVILSASARLTHVLEFLHLFLFYICLVLAYVITYSALEADSPSLTVVRDIAASGNQGLSRQDILQVSGGKRLVEARLEDLLEAGMVYLEEGRYKIARKGSLFIGVFLFYRNLLKKSKGG